MTPKEYVELALRTEADADEIFARMTPRKCRLLHMSMGLDSESGEIADQVKRHVIYGKDLDEVNLIEEMGDMFWYAALLCDMLNVSMEEIMKKNIAKLRARFPDGYSDDIVLDRDLDAEREILEGDALISFEAEIVEEWDVNKGGALFYAHPTVGSRILVEMHDFNNLRWCVNGVDTKVPPSCIKMIRRLT